MRKFSKLDMTVSPLSVSYSMSIANHCFSSPLGLRVLIEKMILEEEEDADLASGKTNWFSREPRD